MMFMNNQDDGDIDIEFDVDPLMVNTMGADTFDRAAYENGDAAGMSPGSDDGGFNEQSPLRLSDQSPSQTPSELLSVARFADSDVSASIRSRLGDLEEALELSAGDASDLLPAELLASIGKALAELDMTLRAHEDTRFRLPDDFDACCQLRDYFNVIRTRLTVEEAARAGADESAQVVAVILRQPFPYLFNKMKSMAEGVFEVQLVVSRRARKVLQVSEAEIVLDTEDKSRPASDDELLGDRVVNWIESNGRLIVRPSVKFLQGSRGKLCRLFLRGRVHVGQQAVALESRPSRGFLIITNDSRWCLAMGEMLRDHVMINRDMDGAPIPAVLSAMQWTLAKMTRQAASMGNPRVFSPAEVQYVFERLHSTCDSSTPGVVSSAAFLKFWGLMGNLLRSIRFQRHVSSLWQRGLIWLLCDRGDAEAALRGKPSGTFLVRFTMSETHPGRFVVVYVKNNHINHYLLKDTDITSKKSLPDFIIEHNSLVNVLKLNAVEAAEGSKFNVCIPDSAVMVSKAVALSDFSSISVGQEETPEAGYVQVI